MTSVLVIAGCDSSGGAGIVRDVRTLTQLGVDAMCALTAVTAQSDATVTQVLAVPPRSWAHRSTPHSQPVPSGR